MLPARKILLILYPFEGVQLIQLIDFRNYHCVCVSVRFAMQISHSKLHVDYACNWRLIIAHDAWWWWSKWWSKCWHLNKFLDSKSIILPEFMANLVVVVTCQQHLQPVSCEVSKQANPWAFTCFIHRFNQPMPKRPSSRELWEQNIKHLARNSAGDKQVEHCVMLTGEHLGALICLQWDYSANQCEFMWSCWLLVARCLKSIHLLAFVCTSCIQATLTHNNRL